MRRMPGILILATIALWIGLDFWFYAKLGNAGTISATIWRTVYYHPSWAFAAGVLVGHLFFQMKEPTAFPPEEKK